MQRVDAEVMDNLKEKIGIVQLDEWEKQAKHFMKDKMDKLLGYDVHEHAPGEEHHHHHDHGEH
jgi:hypothetical protein